MFPFSSASNRRLVALDAGARCVKLVLAEPEGEGLRVLGHKQVDLREEGLLATEEIRRHLAGLIHQWGEWPIAVTLPARLSFSRVVDLPAGAGEPQIAKVIEEQTARLRGLSQSPLVHEARPLSAHQPAVQPYFLTIAREQDVQQHLQQLLEEVNEVRAVSGLAGALVAAQRAFQPGFKDGLLVDWGASETVVVVLRAGEAVFASGFASGNNALVETVATVCKLAGPEAEARLRGDNLLTGPQKLPALCAAVEAWLAALRQVVEEWRQQDPARAPGGAPLPVLLSGGVSGVPGLFEFLANRPEFQFVPWPDHSYNGHVLPLSDFAVACGTALEACHRQPEAPSLLPPALGAHAGRLRRMVHLNTIGLVILALTALLLAGATWRKAARAAEKRALARAGEAALAQVQELSQLVRQRDLAFEQSWPLLDLQERTLDLLHTLRLLQEARNRHDFWSVLLADADSYARGSTLPSAATNRLGLTNPPPLLEEPPARPLLVAEVCVPARGEQGLKVLADLVSELRKDEMLARVDSLPTAQRRSWVDQKVIIPDSHFAIALEFADRGWRPLFQAVKLPEVRSGTNVLRRLAPLPATRAKPPAAAPPAGTISPEE